MTEERNIQDILAEVADQAEQTRDEFTRMYRSNRPAAEPSQVYSIRIPVSRLGRIRKLAAERDVAPTAMLRSWILERLDSEEQSSTCTRAVFTTPRSSGRTFTHETRVPDMPFVLVDTRRSSPSVFERSFSEFMREMAEL
jgi:hypothetical protein